MRFWMARPGILFDVSGLVAFFLFLLMPDFKSRKPAHMDHSIRGQFQRPEYDCTRLLFSQLA